MRNLSQIGGARLRVAVAGLLTGGLLIPGTVLAAPGVPGTLVGTVRCSGQAAPAHVAVALEGSNLSTHTTQSGSFVLTGVPAAQSYTVDAIDPSTSSVASRYNVVVNPGETLDVGTLDLQVCPQPAAVDATDLQVNPQEDIRDISVDVQSDQ